MPTLLAPLPLLRRLWRIIIVLIGALPCYVGTESDAAAEWDADIPLTNLRPRHMFATTGWWIERAHAHNELRRTRMLRLIDQLLNVEWCNACVDLIRDDTDRELLASARLWLPAIRQVYVACTDLELAVCLFMYMGLPCVLLVVLLISVLWPADGHLGSCPPCVDQANDGTSEHAHSACYLFWLKIPAPRGEASTTVRKTDPAAWAHYVHKLPAAMKAFWNHVLDSYGRASRGGLRELWVFYVGACVSEFYFHHVLRDAHFFAYRFSLFLALVRAGETVKWATRAYQHLPERCASSMQSMYELAAFTDKFAPQLGFSIKMVFLLDGAMLSAILAFWCELPVAEWGGEHFRAGFGCISILKALMYTVEQISILLLRLAAMPSQAGVAAAGTLAPYSLDCNIQSTDQTIIALRNSWMVTSLDAVEEVAKAHNRVASMWDLVMHCRQRVAANARDSAEMLVFLAAVDTIGSPAYVEAVTRGMPLSIAVNLARSAQAAAVRTIGYRAHHCEGCSWSISRFFRTGAAAAGGDGGVQLHCLFCAYALDIPAISPLSRLLPAADAAAFRANFVTADWPATVKWIYDAYHERRVAEHRAGVGMTRGHLNNVYHHVFKCLSDPGLESILVYRDCVHCGELRLHALTARRGNAFRLVLKNFCECVQAEVEVDDAADAGYDMDCRDHVCRAERSISILHRCVNYLQAYPTAEALVVHYPVDLTRMQTPAQAAAIEAMLGKQDAAETCALGGPLESLWLTAVARVQHSVAFRVQVCEDLFA